MPVVERHRRAAFDRRLPPDLPGTTGRPFLVRRAPGHPALEAQLASETLGSRARATTDDGRRPQ